MKKVNQKQVAFGRKLGLNFKNCSPHVAIAMVKDIIDKEFWGKKLNKPSDKQIVFAKRFGFDISTKSERVGFAIISDILGKLDLESIKKQELAPGVKVRNKWDSLKQIYTISSIREDGTVFFKGGQGKKTWARNLVKVSKNI